MGVIDNRSADAIDLDSVLRNMDESVLHDRSPRGQRYELFVAGPRRSVGDGWRRWAQLVHSQAACCGQDIVHLGNVKNVATSGV